MRSAADQRRSEPTATLAQKRRTVPGELKKLLAAGAIDDAVYAERRAAYDDAKRTVKRLSGRRKLELGAVVKTLEDVAARGQLTASRLAPLFLTLQRNREWWTTGPLLSSGRRVGFEGSQIVWQYYPGAGIQIQVLGHLRQGQRALVLAPEHRARPGRRRAAAARRRARRRPRVGVLLPLPRGQGAVGLQPRAGHGAAGALARGASGCAARTEVFPVTSRGLNIFERAAPEGVRVPAGAGAHYAQYSFEPGLRILNGFIQSLVGLYDYGRNAADERAKALYATGEARARQEVPTYDTGAWSLYSRGTVTHESDLGYHTLLRDFLKSLCTRTAEPTYCGAVENFTADLTTAPVVRLASRRLRGGEYGRIKMALDKISGIDAAHHARREARAHALRRQPLARVAHARLGGAAHGRDLHGHAERARPRRQHRGVDGRRPGAEAA